MTDNWNEITYREWCEADKAIFRHREALAAKDARIKELVRALEAADRQNNINEKYAKDARGNAPIATPHEMGCIHMRDIIRRALAKEKEVTG